MEHSPKQEKNGRKETETEEKNASFDHALKNVVAGQLQGQRAW
jgi:hypothetical protein